MFQQLSNRLRAVRAALTLVRHPERLDTVFDLEDALPPGDLEATLLTLAATEAGRRALETRPLLGPVDLDALAALPEDSLGHAFASFCRRHGLDPNVLQVTPPADGLGPWIIRHMRETHDLWHVVTGFEPDIPGELGLQAFYQAQVDHPLMAALIAVGFVNAAFFAPHTARERVAAIAHGWTLGQRAEPLFGAPWAELWEMPLSEVRARYGLDEAAITQRAA